MGDQLYLSRLVLNLRNREARRDLNDCMAMHRTLMGAFPDKLSSDGAARAEAGVLYRVEPLSDGSIGVIVQSGLPPDWTSLPPGWVDPRIAPQTKEITESLGRIESGRQLRFKLVSNPTRKIGTKTDVDGRKNNGRRVELRGEEEWLKWLKRKASQAGFQLRSVRAAAHVPDVQTSRDLRSTGVKKAPDGSVSRLTFSGVAFEGRLEVVDVSLFRTNLRAGIGPGKAYGYGLLSLARGD